MYSDGSALQRLSRDQCLTLLASAPVGRIIYTRRALPAVELVNFALDHGDIVIRTDRSGKLAAATRGAVVAFEADQLDLDTRSGWSVTAVGPAAEVTDPDELARLRTIGLKPWAPGARDHFIRISPVMLNGRHLRADDTHLSQRPG
jgi:nitroimidazol reductase NimA-like FMN-containing flavoprotein (pyridoxamine 5'-phosphate oxidase superfamily)